MFAVMRQHKSVPGPQTWGHGLRIGDLVWGTVAATLSELVLRFDG